MSERDHLRHIPILRRLENCPFCGSGVNMVPVYDNSSNVHMMIFCMNNECGAVVQFADEPHPEEMAERFNRRVKSFNLKTDSANVYGKSCYDTNTSLTNN